MASPTRWLRQNSAILMVFLAVFAMVIFGLGPAFDQWMRPGGNPDGGRDTRKDVIAEWGNKNKLTRVDLENWQTRHFQSQQFLEELIRASEDVAKKKNEAYLPMAPRIQPIEGSDRVSQAAVYEQIVGRILLAKKAEQEGVVISDAFVEGYLDMLSGNQGFSTSQLADINRQANQNRVSFETVRRHLKTELLAQQMRILANTGYSSVPNPLEAVEMYQRYNESVECEIYPVEVASIANDEAGTPSSSELKQLFEKGKFHFVDSTGKKPGFKKPNRMSVNYVIIDQETYIQNEINKLTDEEVQKEYDRLVEMESNLVMELVPEDEVPPNTENPESTPAEGAPADGAPADGTPAKNGSENNGASNEAKTEEPPVADPATADPATADPATADPATADPASADPGTGSNSDDPTGAGADGADPGLQGANLKSDSELQFVSFEQDDPANQGGASQDPETKENKATEQESTSADPATAVESGQQSQDETTPPVTQDSTTPPVTQEAAGTANQPLQDDFGSLFSDDKALRKRPVPLAKIVDQVKRSMVQDKVQADVQELAQKVQDELEVQLSMLIAWESRDPSERGAKPELDIKAISDEFKVQVRETELLDFNGLNETDLGKITIPIDMFGRTITMSENMFGGFDRQNKFYLSRHDYGFGDVALFWLTDKEESHVGTFDECKSDVEEFWRRGKKIELATAKATKIADEINSSRQWLSESDRYRDQAMSTGEFTWFKLGILDGGYGKPAGVTSPGNDFMEGVFKLAEKQAGIAVNADRSVVYVVQVKSPRKGIEALGTDFVENQYLPKKAIPREVDAIFDAYRQESQIEWNQEFMDEMNVRFTGR